MAFSRYFLLAVATILLGVVAQQSSGALIAKAGVNKYANLKKKFDIKLIVGDDRTRVISMVQKAVANVDVFANSHKKSGVLGKAAKIMAGGFQNTMKLIGDALNEAFDSIDAILDKVIDDKVGALNELNTKMDHVRKSIFYAGTPIHTSLGAAKSLSGIVNKGGFSEGIDSVQETGTELFENIDVAQFFAQQGLDSNDIEVTKKCLKAAHAAVLSAAAETVTHMPRGAKKVIAYLVGSDESSLKKHEPVENLISVALKAAASADKATVSALNLLNKKFDITAKLGLDLSILNELKEGIAQFIQHSGLSVAIMNDALTKAKELAKVDANAAVAVIQNSVFSAKSALIDGSVKTYEGIGSVGSKINTSDRFNETIEKAERSRVEGTKGIDAFAKVAIRGILSGGEALDNAFEAAHRIIEANEARVFERLYDIINLAFDLLKSGVISEVKLPNLL